jgi:hypothetical protein
MTKAFLIGIQEMEEKIGPEETDRWMEKIGEELAEIEGPGIMGEQEGDLNCFTICLFAPKLDEFIEEMGLPEGHEQILKYVKARYDEKGGPVPVNVMCSMCYAYRKKRGELSGKKNMLHLAAKYRLTENKNLDEEGIKESGHTVKEIKDLLKKYDCINKYID